MPAAETGSATHALLDELKAQTSAQHAAIERGPFALALMQGGLTHAGCVAWLQQRYLLHVGLEAMLDKLALSRPEWQPLLAPEHRLAPAALAALQAFGTTANVEATPETTACLAEWSRWAESVPERLLGAHYVFEGSKNGGRFVLRALERRAHEWAAGASAYLDPHGEVQRQLWQQFRTTLESAAPADVHQRAAVVTGAQASFDLIGRVDDGVLKAVPGAVAAPPHASR